MFLQIRYALAGGRDSDGNGYIYPVLDWNNGEMSASLMCIILIVVGIPRIAAETG
ncbi:hypothetical protein T484DRAFT_1823987 [Baffinella frigidus]|nr:hypothetical protein T484DRAFT_1823987 [Cryptophyta sp. CCMP2293]